MAPQGRGPLRMVFPMGGKGAVESFMREKMRAIVVTTKTNPDIMQQSFIKYIQQELGIVVTTLERPAVPHVIENAALRGILSETEGKFVCTPGFWNHAVIEKRQTSRSLSLWRTCAPFSSASFKVPCAKALTL